MATHYTVPLGTDAETFVRKLVLDGAGTPTGGLTISFLFRDEAGNTLDSGNLLDLGAAPGWYKLPSALALDTGGIYTVEYTIPAGFVAADSAGFATDADSIFVQTEAGRATSEFVKGG